MRTESSESNRHLILRGIAGALALIAAPIAARDLYGTFRGEFDPLLAIFALGMTLFVALLVWVALRGHQPESRAHMKHVLTVGIVFGLIGFAIGFVGPMIWAPAANQGPLLGIFFTGPIGFAVGCLVGWLFAPRRRTIP